MTRSAAKTIRQCAVILLGFFSWALLTAPSAAQITFTDVLGGSGGSHFVDECGDTQALVAINYILIYAVNTVGPVCQAIPGGLPQGPLVGLSTWGNPNVKYGNDYAGQIRCPPGMVVEGIHVQGSPPKTIVSPTPVVLNFALICRNLVTNEHGETYYSPTRVGPTPVDWETTASCGSNAMAFGVAGQYGNLIDAIGLVCRTVGTPAPPVVNAPPPNTLPPPPPPPKPNKPPLKIDNGDQNADAGNGGGGPSAATDTTIYDQPGGNDIAYLSTGDPVSIVSCNGDNWCRISKPRRGWVWGDDLRR